MFGISNMYEIQYAVLCFVALCRYPTVKGTCLMQRSEETESELQRWIKTCEILSFVMV